MPVNLNDKKYKKLNAGQRKALEAVINKIKKYKLHAILKLTIDGEWFYFDLMEIDNISIVNSGPPIRCGICGYYPVPPDNDFPCPNCCGWWDKRCKKYYPKIVNVCPVCKQKRVTSSYCP